MTSEIQTQAKNNMNAPKTTVFCGMNINKAVKIFSALFVFYIIFLTVCAFLEDKSIWGLLGFVLAMLIPSELFGIRSIISEAIIVEIVLSISFIFFIIGYRKAKLTYMKQFKIVLLVYAITLVISEPIGNIMMYSLNSRYMKESTKILISTLMYSFIAFVALIYIIMYYLIVSRYTNNVEEELKNVSEVRDLESNTTTEQK